MSYIVEVHAIGESRFSSNQLAFATREEAQAYGSDLFSRWYGIDEFRVVESDRPVNYSFVNGHLQEVQHVI